MSIRRDDKSSETFTLGSSVYGGRPTFTLVRDEHSTDVTLTLYELLPAEQAEARQRRLERHSCQISKAVPFDEVVNDEVNGAEDWTWDDWVAVKVQRLSGARIRSMLQLLDGALREADMNPSEITGTGNATVLLPEATGIRLSLGFVGIKPIMRVDRMRALARGVEHMGLEECYYWHSKCRSPKSPNGEKALRMLLTNHIN